MKIGIAIKKIRQKKGINQKKLAEKSNISASYLSEIEKGEKNPHFTVLAKICHGLKVGVPTLYFVAFEKEDLNTKNKEKWSQDLEILEDTNPLFIELIKNLVFLFNENKNLYNDKITDWDRSED